MGNSLRRMSHGNSFLRNLYTVSEIKLIHKGEKLLYNVEYDKFKIEIINVQVIRLKIRMKCGMCSF